MLSGNCLTRKGLTMRPVASVRQLGRDTARILDEVAATGMPMTITRRGVPIAELRPLRMAPWAPTPEDEALGHELPAVDLDALSLTDVERDLLTSCQGVLSVDEAVNRLGRSETMLALAHLELTKGLLTKTSGGYVFTDQGRDVTRVLLAEAEA